MGTRHPCSFGSGCDTLHGNAKLCTENGSTYSLKLTGAVHSWWSTDGASTNIDLTGKPLPKGWVVAFKGMWAGPALPLADTDNSFTEVFTRRGAVRRTTSTAGSGIARGTLHNASSQAFDNACRALAAGTPKLHAGSAAAALAATSPWGSSGPRSWRTRSPSTG